MLDALVREGWMTAAACLAGAIAILAGLRSALHRTELALRDRLVVVVMAGGLATAGIGSQLVRREQALELAGQAGDVALGAASDHPLVVAGVVFAGLLAMVVSALVWWIRFWVRTVLRMMMLGAFLFAVLLWCVARFVLVGYFDGWSGLELGPEGWRAMLDGSGVTLIVLTVLSMLRTKPPPVKNVP